MQLRGKAVPATAGISQVKLLDTELESSVPCCIVGVPGEAESLLLGSAQRTSLPSLSFAHKEKAVDPAAGNALA